MARRLKDLAQDLQALIGREWRVFFPVAQDFDILDPKGRDRHGRKDARVAGSNRFQEHGIDDLPALCLGRVLNISPVLANRFDLIYQLSSRLLASIDAVRDNGVPLTFAADYPTIAALRGAAIPAGQYATALSLGLLRIGSTANGEITVDATEGGTGQRSAARTVQRILDHRGFVAGTDYEAATFEALHNANPAEVGVFIGTDAREISIVVSQLLASVNGWIVADRLGRFRVGRIVAPVHNPDAPVLDRAIILDKGDGIEPLVTQDENDGVPAKKVTVRYARNWTFQNKATLDRTAATDAVKAFAIEDFRNADAKDDSVASRHLLAGDLMFDTLLVREADAIQEAQRWLAIHSLPRARYRVPVRAAYAAGTDLGDTVTLRLDRFDLSDGKPFLVIGQEVERATGNVRFELWG